MRALVTGANGHIGAHLVRDLVAAGWDVTGFVREGADLRGLRGVDLPLFRGDIRDLAALERAARGQDAIFHLAALYSTRPDDPEDVLRTSLLGTTHVLRAASGAGVGRVVYTSSQVAVGYADSADALRNERHWNEAPRNPYYRAKTEAERLVAPLAEKHDVDVVIVAPAVVLGALDYRVTPSTRMLKGWLNHATPTGHGAYNFVLASDVAAMMRLAHDRGGRGERYILGGDNLDLKAAGELVGRIAGRAPRHQPLPRWMVRAMVPTFRLVASITGRSPLFTADEAYEVVGRYGVFDTSKARRALRHEPKGSEAVFRESARWLAFLGELAPETARRILAEAGPDPTWEAP